MQRRTAMLAAKWHGMVLKIFDDDLKAIQSELNGFRTVETAAAGDFYVGFFDDLMHLMGFMMTGVCTWVERDKQVLNADFHFGKIALKDANGRVLGLSQVQLTRYGVKGGVRKVSAKGWRALALPGINLMNGDLGMTRERALLAILEAAQSYAEAAGMEGAFIPQSTGIHSQSAAGQAEIKNLVHKGWLKPVSLEGTVRLSKIHNYTYEDVYWVQIPKEARVLQSADVQERIQKENQEPQQLAKQRVLSFGSGIGEIVTQNGVPDQLLIQLQEVVEKIYADFPPQLMNSLFLNSSVDDFSFKIRLDPRMETSFMNKRREGVEWTVGRDLMIGSDDFDRVKLSDQLAEIFAAYLLKDYDLLNEQRDSNENAYFKLNVVKALINHKNYLLAYHQTMSGTPVSSKLGQDELRRLEEPQQRQLDGFTAGWDAVNQYNLFLSLFGNADPRFIISNYMHVWSSVHDAESRSAQAEKDIDQILENVSIENEISVAHLRNFAHVLFMDGKSRIRIVDTVHSVERFDRFDDQDWLEETVDSLRSVTQQNAFYASVRSLIEYALPLSENELAEEMGRLVDDGLFEKQDKLAATREALREIMVRRIGSNAVKRILSFLSGNNNDLIPYVKVSHADLDTGDDADRYGFMEFDGDGHLVLRTEWNEEEAPSPADWVNKLFPLPMDPPSDLPGDDESPQRSELRSVREEPLKVFVSALDLASFNENQLAELFAAAQRLANKVRVIIYNYEEIDEKIQKRLAGIPYIPAVGSFAMHYKRLGANSGRLPVHFSKSSAPPVLQRYSGRVNYFRYQAEETGVFWAACFFGLEEAALSQFRRDEHGFWVVADSQLASIFRSMQAHYVVAWSV